VTIERFQSVLDAYPDKPAGYIVATARRQHAEHPDEVSHAASHNGSRESAVDRSVRALAEISARTGVDLN
jgi:hypothetical protein